MTNPEYDVVIVGGGPAGSTCGTFLRKYNPRLKVLILERERFPRDHVGESQLPVIGHVLDEMGVWDRVERANFPVKIGATYRWGQSDKLWNFEFITGGEFRNESRPSHYRGQRTQTAFQVDRAIYDDILLDHARKCGCEVRQETAVRSVQANGDRVESLTLQDGEEVTARHYVDASGHSGLIRRAMNVETECPTTLQNIAIWDYWQNAEWASTVGNGGTRVLVMSLGYGWIWFIPLGKTRTSVGLIVPADYYRTIGKRPQELYDEALRSEPKISELLRNGTAEGRLATTKDWSFIADRLVGENWFLAGESAGFADPILAAGMSLAHIGARDVAYTILALDRGDYEPDWLRQRYCESHRHHIRNHIRFADFWYTHNGQFVELQETAQRIASDTGLDLSLQDAWRWLGTGGFIDGNTASSGVAGYSFFAAKTFTASFLNERTAYDIAGKTHFKINLEGAEKTWGADLDHGRVTRHRCYRRGNKVIPNAGLCGWFIRTLREERSFEELRRLTADYCAQNGIGEAKFAQFRRDFVDMLEALVNDGWVEARTQDGERTLEVDLDPSGFVRPFEDRNAVAAS